MSPTPPRSPGPLGAPGGLPVHPPIWTGQSCKRCKYPDILNELITCHDCNESFHAVCRDTRGAFSNYSACSKTFLGYYGPLSAHYGDNANRFGYFKFQCSDCNLNSRTSVPVKQAAVDTGTNTPQSSVTETHTNEAEAQTFMSGNILDKSMNKLIEASPLIDVDDTNDPLIGTLELQKLITTNEILLQKIEALEVSSSTLTQTVETCMKSFGSNQTLGPSPENSHTPYQGNSTATSSPEACPVDPYKDLHQSFLDEDTKTGIVKLIDDMDGFKTVNSSTVDCTRDVIYFGEYSYRYGKTEHAARTMPKELQAIIHSLEKLYPKSILNSCLVSRYKSGSNGIPMHQDNEPVIAPWSDIVTLSLGAQRRMSFQSLQGSTSYVDLPDNSALVFSRRSQETWKHGILPDTSTTARYSLTFRIIAPFYLNSTVIIGDSNTEKLQFGAGRKTFGRWLPGIRVKASKIEHIPQPDELYPFRNAVFHCGINDLRDQKFSPPDTDTLARNLLAKANSYISKFPKMKVRISLLLPTKDVHLNQLVYQFNSRISALTRNNSNILLISHDNLAFSDGRMRPDLGRRNRDNSLQVKDSVHLGYSGIILFSQNIKNSIVKSSSPQTINSSRPNPGTVRLPDSMQMEYPYFKPNPQYRSQVNKSNSNNNRTQNVWFTNSNSNCTDFTSDQWGRGVYQNVSQGDLYNGYQNY